MELIPIVVSTLLKQNSTFKYNKKNIYCTAISEKQEFKCNKNYRYVKKKILIKLRLTSKIY